MKLETAPSKEIKRQAQQAVNQAVKRGDLPRARYNQCVDCGSSAWVYHHSSYDPKHWLDVLPLCSQCHHDRHADERPPSSHRKMTIDQVKKLRQLYKTKKYSNVELGKMFGVTASSAMYAATGRSYKWVD